MFGMIIVVQEPKLYFQHRSQYIYMVANIHLFLNFMVSQSERKWVYQE